MRRQTHRLPSLRLYALVELLIGVSALAVPSELAFGRAFLERLDAGHPISHRLYYILAGLWIGITLVPWCACMGATFPFAMAAIRERGSTESPRSFSYLYLANVLGAVAGAAIPLLLIECSIPHLRWKPPPRASFTPRSFTRLPGSTCGPMAFCSSGTR